MRGKTSVTLTGLVVGAILLFAGIVLAQNVTWTPATTNTYTDADNVVRQGTFTPAEMATMKFKLRSRRKGDTSPRKEFGATAGGIATWSGDFAATFQLPPGTTPAPGEIWEITVTQIFKNQDYTDVDGNVIVGKELESAESEVALYQFPLAPDRTADAPSVPVITE
jgi:hypothetical protein